MGIQDFRTLRGSRGGSASSGDFESKSGAFHCFGGECMKCMCMLGIRISMYVACIYTYIKDTYGSMQLTEV